MPTAPMTPALPAWSPTPTQQGVPDWAPPALKAATDPWTPAPFTVSDIPVPAGPPTSLADVPLPAPSWQVIGGAAAARRDHARKLEVGYAKLAQTLAAVGRAAEARQAWRNAASAAYALSAMAAMYPDLMTDKPEVVIPEKKGQITLFARASVRGDEYARRGQEPADAPPEGAAAPSVDEAVSAAGPGRVLAGLAVVLGIGYLAVRALS